MPTATQEKKSSQPTAEQRFADQRKREQLAEMRRNHFASQCDQALRGIHLHAHFTFSKDLQADSDALDQEVAAVKKQVDQSLRQLNDALHAAETSDNYMDVIGAIDSNTLDRPTVCQQMVRLWETARVLAERAVAEAAPLPAKADAHAEKIVAEVKDGLTKLGCGLEAQQAFRDNRTAAERQFDLLARVTNLRSRAAIAAAKEAHAALHEHRARVGVARAGLDAAKALLKKTALQLVNI